LTELAMSMVMLVIAMTLTVKLLGFVAHERRAAERRERALVETANVMERITAHEFDEVTPEFAGRVVVSPEARGVLHDPRLEIEVTPTEPAAGRAAKRVVVFLRWKSHNGEWETPVRLTAWIERRSRPK
jgi:hypothetical protein